MNKDLYVLVLAGGSGQRFWPLSRKSRPKQLLRLFSERSLLEDTIARLEGLAPKEQVLVLTNHHQEASVREVCAGLPEENIVAEPAKRDTAAAVALGAAWIAVRNPEATMVVLPADHLIQDRESFQQNVRDAAAAAQSRNALITIGIQPTWACPSFGYIEMSDQVEIDSATGSTRFFEVKRFREKPDPELAESFLRAGNYRWNAGMFIWTVPTIITQFNRHAPEIGTFISKVHDSKGLEETLENEFPGLPKISIDYAIMERAGGVLAAEADFDWDDVGTWTAVARYFEQDEQNNASNTSLSIIDAEDNIVFSDQKKRVGLLGVSDLIIVETDDALLVCDVHEAEKVKKLIDELPEELR